MGCGASVETAATEAEKAEMFNFALKEMMIHIGTVAITKGEEVQVKAPVDQVGKVRESVAKIRAAAKEAKEKMSGGDGKAANAVNSAGGLLGGAASMLSSAAAAVDKGLDAAGGAAGGVAEAALNTFADGIEKIIFKLDEDFAKVGAEVAKAKIDAIIQVFKSVINDRKIENPQVLVRGAPPHGKTEAEACPKDAVSGYLTDSARSDLVDAMLPVCEEAVKGSTACKSWKTLIDTYNSANAKIGELGESAKQFQQAPIELEIERYIVEQIVLGYRKLMADEETAKRAAPGSVAVPKNPNTFVLCWDFNTYDWMGIKSKHYQDFKNKNW